MAFVQKWICQVWPAGHRELRREEARCPMLLGMTPCLPDRSLVPPRAGRGLPSTIDARLSTTPLIRMASVSTALSRSSGWQRRERWRLVVHCSRTRRFLPSYRMRAPATYRRRPRRRRCFCSCFPWSLVSSGQSSHCLIRSGRSVTEWTTLLLNCR